MVDWADVMQLLDVRGIVAGALALADCKSASCTRAFPTGPGFPGRSGLQITSFHQRACRVPIIERFVSLIE
jgi:hypothetical protein